MQDDAPGDGGQRDLRALDLALGSTPDQVRAALVRVTPWLARAGIAAETAATVELVLAEALNNVVEHAYGQGGDGRIDLRLICSPPQLSVVIRDSGAPMPDGSLPLGRATQIDVPREDLPEGGFGWFLIRSLADCLSYCRVDGRNHLEIGFDLHRLT